MKIKSQSNLWFPSQKEIQLEKTWTLSKIKKLGQKKLQNLALKAQSARKNAYQPYSKYSVGAALLSKSDKIYQGCNAEVVSYSETEHAESAAISAAINNGEIKKSGNNFIDAIAVCHEAESGPCGRCRQIIAEHAENCLVLDVDLEGKITKVTSLAILFPYAFTPSSLNK